MSDNDLSKPPDWACGRSLSEQVKALTWCAAELRWQYDHHSHHCSEHTIGWGPEHPHWL